jgi:hypothetical protein
MKPKEAGVGMHVKVKSTEGQGVALSWNCPLPVAVFHHCLLPIPTPFFNIC